jgi:hypothetical protein
MSEPRYSAKADIEKSIGAGKKNIKKHISIADSYLSIDLVVVLDVGLIFIS